MKMFLRISFFVIFSFSFYQNVRSQGTTLAAGDIAFTGYNSSTTDNFSFIVIRFGGLNAGTQIRFTDRGWNAGACGTNGWAATAEGDILWTSHSAIPYGKSVVISGLTSNKGTVTGTAVNLSNAGDQLFAIQGPLVGPFTMLAGIHMNEEPGVTSAVNWDNVVAPTQFQSNLPTCLTNGTQALFINPEINNARAKSSIIIAGNPFTDRSRVNNAANWEGNETTEYTLPANMSGLPVKFTSIKAFEKNGKIQVEWGIGLEEKIKDYTIERSYDGLLYADAGSVAATGKPKYNWSETSVASKTHFYRIRANELDGTIKYSSVVVVNFSGTTKELKLFPTLIKNHQFHLQISNFASGNYKLNIFNAGGQLVFAKTIVHNGGSAAETINLPEGLIKGVYKVLFSSAELNLTKTILIQ